MFKSLRYPTKQQALIWKKRRERCPPSKIAKELKVSRPYISKSQRIAEQRIKSLLQHAASINGMSISNLSATHGFAEGYCHVHRSKAYITYSPKIGVHVWFNHTGDCGTCAKLYECNELLSCLAEEWNLPLEENIPPTESGSKLFDLMRRQLGWLRK